MDTERRQSQRVARRRNSDAVATRREVAHLRREVARLHAEQAALTGLLIDRLQQEAQTRQRAARAEIVREIGRQLSDELDFGRFLDNAVAHLTALLDVRDCLLLTWDEEARELTPEIYIGGGERQIWRVTIRPDEQRGLTSVVVNTRRTVHTADYLDECRRRGLEPVMPPGDWSALAWVGLPLIARGA